MADVSVRPARPEDATAIGAIQARTWHQSYSGVLPAQVLDQMSSDALTEVWAASIAAPLSHDHLVLVATAAGQPVGFLAVGPASDPDSEPADLELLVLCVDPVHQRQGHGSRLLSALADLTPAPEGPDPVTRLVAWAFAADAEGRRFLNQGGWEPDGATRVLGGDGTEAEQVRLHVGLPGAPE